MFCKVLCQIGFLLHLLLKKRIDLIITNTTTINSIITFRNGYFSSSQSWKSINTLQEGKLQFHLAGTLMELCETGIEAPMKLWMADPAAPLSLLSHFRMRTFCQRLSSKN